MVMLVLLNLWGDVFVRFVVIFFILFVKSINLN